jgi:hypothetical protein
VDVGTGEARRLTSVLGAAAAPEVDPNTGGVYYLSLHAAGWDVYRVHPDSVTVPDAPAFPPALAPAVQRTAGFTADTLPRAALPPSRPYGIGPRWTRLLPMGAWNVDGEGSGFILHNADPVGRLALALRGAWGDAGMERGAGVDAVWRGMRPTLAAQAFWMDHDPSRLAGYDAPGLDARYAGAVLSAGNAWSRARLSQEWRLGASAGRLDLDGWASGSGVDGGPDEGGGARTLAFGRFAAGDGRRSGSGYATAGVALAGAAGRTLGEDWARGTATVAFDAGAGMLGLRAEATMGRVSRGAPRWERFTVGGVRPVVADEMVLSQRVSMPGLRWGTLQGEDLLTYRLSTSLGALTPYFWGGTTDRTWDRWQRVAGLELATSFPGYRAAGWPAARMLAGVAYGLDGIQENDVTAYIGITYVP